MFLVFGLSKVIDQIGQMKDLDSISKPLSDVVSKVTAPDAVKNALSGTWLGHQLHPMLTDLPIGAWSMASALDLTSRGTMPKVSERLVGLGILTAVPAALSGASDWSESYGKEQRLGLLHALGNSVGTTLQVASWISRRCGHHRTGTGLLARRPGRDHGCQLPWRPPVIWYGRWGRSHRISKDHHQVGRRRRRKRSDRRTALTR